MMAASFGGHWASNLPSHQICGMRQAFYGGAQSVLSAIPLSVPDAEPLRQECSEYIEAYKRANGID